ncbi:hypothetical protein WJX84_003301 [Apatococcus fuscideae]|uniref:Uncharacterized protein n=1 Tax=Apatococcus fuscideae TaxID=2026836 RepID=A0AAW1S3F0_9CHLO
MPNLIPYSHLKCAPGNSRWPASASRQNSDDAPASGSGELQSRQSRADSTALKMKQLREQKQLLEGFQSELTTLHIAEMMQTAQEQKLMKLANRLLRLRASGAPIRQRQGLIVGAISAINEIRRTTPHFSQKKAFTPSVFVEELSNGQGFSMDAAVNSVMSGSYGAAINISMGPLAGRYPVSDALTAPIHDYVDTQRQMLMTVADCMDEALGDCKSMAGQHVTRLMTEVIALSMCTMHARKRRLTWFQHLNLQTLRAGKLDLKAWLDVADMAQITPEQREQLVHVRETYIALTRQTLGVRTQLWQNVRDALASSQQAVMTGASSMAACGQTEMEAVEALKQNMEMYLDAYGHMLRDWTMVILTPFQIGVICAKAIPLTGKFTQDCPGLYLLEALAIDAGKRSTADLLSSVGSAPVLATFAPRMYQSADSWRVMRDAASVDPRMN